MRAGETDDETLAGLAQFGGEDDPADHVVFEYARGDRGRAAVRGAFWSALNTVIPAALTGLVFVITSRYLRPSEFGLVALAISIVMFASGFGPTAFGEALIQRQVIRRSHLDTVFWLAMGSAALIYVAVIAVSPLMARATGQADMTVLVAAIALKLFFDFTAIVPNALITRTMSFHVATARTTVATLVSAVVALGLVMAGYGLWAIALAQIASAVASCLAAFWGARWLPGLRVRRSSLRDLARYGVFASANRFLQTMNLDQLIIGTLVNPAALGVYNFSRRLIVTMMDIVSGGLTSVTHVLLSSLQDDQARVRDAFMMATFGCSLVAFPVFLGLAAVAADAIPVIFGPNWQVAVWPVRFFCVIGVMGAIGIIQASLITSQGKAQWWFYYQLGRNILTIATVIVLYPAGIAPIVLVLMVQTLLFWPITLVMASRLIGLGAGEYFRQFLRPLAAVLVMIVGVGFIATATAGWHAVPRLIAETAGGAASYATAILVLCRTQLRALWRAVRPGYGPKAA